jgi:hypothetical protein
MKMKIRLLILTLLVSTSIGISKTQAQIQLVRISAFIGSPVREWLLFPDDFSENVTDYILRFPELPTSERTFTLGISVLGVTAPLPIHLYENGLPVGEYETHANTPISDLFYDYTFTDQPVIFDVLIGPKAYKITVVPPPRLSQLMFATLVNTELLTNFSPNVTNYTVELPSYQANETPLRFRAIAGPCDTIQFRINGELSETVTDGFLSKTFDMESEPVLFEFAIGDKVYKVTVIPYDVYLSQLSLKCNNRELLKNFNNKIYSYSVFVADSLSSGMIPVKWEATFLQGMTVELNGQLIDSCVIENIMQKCHGTQLINRDSLNTLEFKVVCGGDTSIYNVQLKVDVKVPATKLTIQGNNGTSWDLDPSPEVLSEYDMSAYYRNSEDILEKRIYLNIDRSIDSIKFDVEAPKGYNITKPEGWRQITSGVNIFDVQTSQGIHKMNYHIIIDRGTIVNVNVAYIADYLNLPQEVSITEQERRYGTNSDTLIYVVPASATNIKIAVNNVPADIIIDNTSNLGTFALSSPDMQFLVKGTSSHTGLARNTVIRVLKDIVSLNNFSVTVHKKDQPNMEVPICIFPQFSPEIDTYMCIVPESEFEERTLRITTQYQNPGQVEIGGFRIGDVQHDERYAFIKAVPDTSFHSLTNHQYSTQNSLRTDNFSVDSEVSAHQIYVDSLGGNLNYKIEKQLDGYYFITVKNGNMCKIYNLIVVSVNHAKIVNDEGEEIYPDENRYMGLLNPLNGELKFTGTGVYDYVNYPYINYENPEIEYRPCLSALSVKEAKWKLFGSLIVLSVAEVIFVNNNPIPRVTNNGEFAAQDPVIENRPGDPLPDGAEMPNVAFEPFVAIGAAENAYDYIIIGFGGVGGVIAGGAASGGATSGGATSGSVVIGCNLTSCYEDSCYFNWMDKWKYSKNSNIEIKNSTDATTYQNLGDYNTIHVYPWSSNCEATFKVNGVGNQFIIHSTNSNHATLHFMRPTLCTLLDVDESLALSKNEKNNRLIYRKNQKGTDMKLQILDGANANTVTVENDLHVDMEIRGNNNHVHSERKLLVDLYGQNNTVVCDSVGNEIRCNLNNNTMSIFGSHIYMFGDITQITLDNAANNTIDLLGYSETGTLTDILNQYKNKVIARTVNLQGNSQNNSIQGVGYNTNNKPAGNYDWTLNCIIDNVSDKNKINISNWNTVSIINNGQPYKISRETGAYELILNCQKAGMSINGN